MKLEHCFKCKKQIEFRDKKNPNVIDDKKSQMNKLETSRRSEGCDCFVFWYCDICWYKMGTLVQMKGYLPRGMDGFSEIENYG